MALTARRLCTEHIDPLILAPWLSCRFIALDKCPGVRPIGVGDTSRRIIAKAICTTLQFDIKDAVSLYQLCARHTAGVEAAVHTVQELFSDQNTEAVLLVYAKNAFNSLNRITALHNVQALCPSLATVLINCYRSPTDLFNYNDIIPSQEGTTQGDPFAMPFYALATLSLIKSLPTSVNQVWYVNDATAIGSLQYLKCWWDTLIAKSPSYGYFVNPSKSWLVVKKGLISDASNVFGDSNINITAHG